MEKKKILVLENSTHITGALKSICRTAVDLKDQFSFVFVAPSGSTVTSWLNKFDLHAVYEIKLLELKRNILALLAYLPTLIVNTVRVKRILVKENIALIHNNDLYNLIPVVYKIFGGTRPYVCHIRFLPNRFPRLLFNFWLWLHVRFAEKIIVVSRHLKNQLPPNSKIVLIPNELPLVEKYDVVEDSNDYVFLYIANYILGKGHDHALHAFLQIHHDIPAWRLRFVGSDMGLERNKKFRRELEQAAVENGIADKIEWLGFADDVEKEYKRAEIVLNFSESESFSITCVEAQYYGRALIASDCGGPGEIITHKKNGLLVPNKDVNVMAKAMKQLALDKSLRLELARHARSSARENYSVEKTSMVIKSIYLEALKVSF